MINAFDTSLTPPAPKAQSKRRVVHRTRGQRHGPITRLMSPSDLGELLRPFVFLDHLDSSGAGPQLGLHPHSGIATVTWIMEGNVSYEDTTGETGKIPQGGLEWMQAGRWWRVARRWLRRCAARARLSALAGIAARGRCRTA